MLEGFLKKYEVGPQKFHPFLPLTIFGKGRCMMKMIKAKHAVLILDLINFLNYKKESRLAHLADRMVKKPSNSFSDTAHQ